MNIGPGASKKLRPTDPMLRKLSLIFSMSVLSLSLSGCFTLSKLDVLTEPVGAAPPGNKIVAEAAVEKSTYYVLGIGGGSFSV